MKTTKDFSASSARGLGAVVGDASKRCSQRNVTLGSVTHYVRAAMMTLTTLTAGAWSGSGTTADPYIISSSADWTTFCDLLANNTKGYFTGKTVKSLRMVIRPLQ